jgi:hypothetical protein
VRVGDEEGTLLESVTRAAKPTDKVSVDFDGSYDPVEIRQIKEL